MPNNRVPVEKARITGADKKNPGRHKKRKAPDSTMLGEPSVHMDDHAKAAWVAFKKEVPWLKESHRAFMELVARYRAKEIQEGLGTTEAKTYQSMLSKMGLTPADESKVNPYWRGAPEMDEQQDEEQRDEFFDN